MKGEYWIFGGHEVEREGKIGPNGGNLRTNMDRTDKKTIIRLLRPGEKVYVKCWFFVTYKNPETDKEIEGYVNAVNVDAGYVEFGTPAE